MKKTGRPSILYFGIYSKGVEYPRNTNLIQGLIAQGAAVQEAHIDLAGSFLERMQVARNPVAAARFFLRIAAGVPFLTRRFVSSSCIDAVIVGHPGYFHVHLARFMKTFFKKPVPIVYDVFIPLHEALVEDRKLIAPKSRIARILHRFEGAACRAADLCLIDTETHGRYLIRAFGLSEEKVHRVFVGPTIRDVYNTPVSCEGNNRFTVLFVGTYIPLHGVEVILAAARRLKTNPDIRFLMVGKGQLKEEMQRLSLRWKLENVMFKDWIPTHLLGPLIRSCDLSLGIFGATPKAKRVIPSKIFDICAAGAPFITADTPAVREVFRHGKNAWLIAGQDPEALAGAVLTLQSNPSLRATIAAGAFQTGKEIFSTQQIGKSLVDLINKKIFSADNPFQSSARG